MAHSNNYAKESAALLDFLADSPVRMNFAVKIAMRTSADMIRKQAMENCPVGAPAGEGADSGLTVGALRDSIRVVVAQIKDQTYAFVHAGGKTAAGVVIAYGHLIEYSGARPHVIKAKKGKLKIGGRSFAAINHPGMRAHPFLRPAMDAKEAAVVAAVNQEIDRALRKKAK